MKMFLVVKIVVLAIVLTSVVKAKEKKRFSDPNQLTYASPNPGWVMASNVSRGKPRLSITNFVNYAGLAQSIGPLATEGIQMALDGIKRNHLLDDYELIMDLQDDLCWPGIGVIQVAYTLQFGTSTETKLENLLPIMGGPICGHNQLTGPLLKYYNFIAVAAAAFASPVYSDRRRYDGMYALLPSPDILYEAVPVFLKSQGWKKIYMITDKFDADWWQPFENILQDNIKKQDGMILAGVSKSMNYYQSWPNPEPAVAEIAEKDPRIIVVNTPLSGIVACWLYRYGLHGPKYVFFAIGYSYILPNIYIRARFPDNTACTDKMIFTVLQSFIFFTYDMPINGDENPIDSFGLSARGFDREMQERIEQPENYEKTFYFRGMLYDQTMAIGMILNATETELRAKNDTLLNWITTSENFRKNGIHINRLMRKHAERLSYDGATSRRPNGPNRRSGRTCFYQMQASSREIDYSKDLTPQIKPSRVACYDGYSGNISFERAPLRWNTGDGQPPLDALQIFDLRGPIVGETSKWIVIVLSSLLLLSSLCLLIVNEWKSKSVDAFMKSIPKCNSLLLVGIISLAIFNLVLPYGSDSPHVNCITASFLLVIGSSLSTSSILAKLSIAYAMVFKQSGIRFTRLSNFRNSAVTGSKTSSKGFTAASNSRQSIVGSGSSANLATPQPVSSSNKVNNSNSVSGITPIPKSSTAKAKAPTDTFTINVERRVSGKYIRIRLLNCIAWTVAQMCLMVIWMGVVPFRTVKLNREFELPGQGSIAYQHYTFVCDFKLTANVTSQVIAAILSASLGLVLLQSLKISFVLKKHKFTEINDFNLARITSINVALVVVAGIVVIGALFGDEDPAITQLAISAITLIVGFFSELLIFGPKLRHLGR